jgi:putative acetyltransferase
MIIRPFQESDAEQLLHLFFHTIRTVNLADYTQEQVEAWAPDLKSVDLFRWQESFKNKYVFVAELESTIAGFGELEPNGHIDRFYISHLFVGKGVGKKIYAELETKARELRLERLFVEASITAKPFFEKLGYSVIKFQTVERKGVKLSNYQMEKFLK